MNMKSIIFDFDGVLADSFNQLYALNKMAMATVGVNLSESQYRDFFMGNIHEAFRNFIKNDTAYQKFSQIRQQNFDKYYLPVQLFFEVPEFLNKVKEKFVLIIASSGKQDRITDLLKTGGLEKCFQIIAASSDYSKERIINEIVGQLGLPPAELILVSDTCGDLILAKKFGFKAIGASWGFQAPTKLELAGPDFIAENFSGLLQYLKKSELK